MPRSRSLLLALLLWSAIYVRGGTSIGSPEALQRQQQHVLREQSEVAAASASGDAPRVGAGGAARLRDGPLKPATPVWPTQFSVSSHNAGLMLNAAHAPHLCGQPSNTTPHSKTPSLPSPQQQHHTTQAVLFQNRSSQLALTTLYYDWPRRRNLNLIQSQLGARGEVWDVEHDNGTSFVFSRLEPACRVLHFDVGILVPDWLAGATLLGSDATDGFVVDVWTKAGFIDYFNDNATGRPVRWRFLESGADLHVMRWSPGDRLSEAHWQAPAYCFSDPNATCPSGGGRGGCAPAAALDGEPLATGRLLRAPGGGDGGGGGSGERARRGGAVQDSGSGRVGDGGGESSSKQGESSSSRFSAAAAAVERAVAAKLAAAAQRIGRRD